jgi:hypothetical protein
MIPLFNTRYNDNTFNYLPCAVCGRWPLGLKERIDCEAPRCTFCLYCYIEALESNLAIQDLKLNKFLCRTIIHYGN